MPTYESPPPDPYIEKYGPDIGQDYRTAVELEQAIKDYEAGDKSVLGKYGAGNLSDLKFALAEAKRSVQRKLRIRGNEGLPRSFFVEKAKKSKETLNLIDEINKAGYTVDLTSGKTFYNPLNPKALAQEGGFSTVSGGVGYASYDLPKPKDSTPFLIGSSAKGKDYFLTSGGKEVYKVPASAQIYPITTPASSLEASLFSDIPKEEKKKPDFSPKNFSPYIKQNKTIFGNPAIPPEDTEFRKALYDFEEKAYREAYGAWEIAKGYNIKINQNNFPLIGSGQGYEPYLNFSKNVLADFSIGIIEGSEIVLGATPFYYKPFETEKGLYGYAQELIQPIPYTFKIEKQEKKDIFGSYTIPEFKAEVPALPIIGRLFQTGTEFGTFIKEEGPITAGAKLIGQGIVLEPFLLGAKAKYYRAEEFLKGKAKINERFNVERLSPSRLIVREKESGRFAGYKYIPIEELPGQTYTTPKGYIESLTNKKVFTTHVSGNFQYGGIIDQTIKKIQGKPPETTLTANLEAGGVRGSLELGDYYKSLPFPGSEKPSAYFGYAIGLGEARSGFSLRPNRTVVNLGRDFLTRVEGKPPAFEIPAGNYGKIDIKTIRAKATQEKYNYGKLTKAIEDFPEPFGGKGKEPYGIENQAVYPGRAKDFFKTGRPPSRGTIAVLERDLGKRYYFNQGTLPNYIPKIFQKAINFLDLNTRSLKYNLNLETYRPGPEFSLSAKNTKPATVSVLDLAEERRRSLYEPYNPRDLIKPFNISGREEERVSRRRASYVPFREENFRYENRRIPSRLEYSPRENRRARQDYKLYPRRDRRGEPEIIRIDYDPRIDYPPYEPPGEPQRRPPPGRPGPPPREPPSRRRNPPNPFLSFSRPKNRETRPDKRPSKKVSLGFLGVLYKGGKPLKFINTTPLTKENAIAYGASYVGGNVKRSFKIIQRGYAVQQNIRGPTYTLRQGKKDPLLYVEKSRYAINTGGEVMGLRIGKLSKNRKGGFGL